MLFNLKTDIGGITITLRFNLYYTLEKYYEYLIEILILLQINRMIHFT